jgi:hypothetical protein
MVVDAAGNDPFANAKKENKSNISNWNPLPDTEWLSDHLSFHYAILYKQDDVIEYHLKVSMTTLDGPQDVTYEVCLRLGEGDTLDTITLRTFKLNQIEFSGICMDAVMFLCTRNMVTQVQKVKKISFLPFSSDTATISFFDMLVSRGLWKKRGKCYIRENI